MKQIIGIWPPDYYQDVPYTALTELVKEGFNAILIRTDWRQDDTLESYLDRFEWNFRQAVAAGFQYFLVDFAQGLGDRGIETAKPNYNFRLALERIVSAANELDVGRDKIYTYVGEPVINWLKKGLLFGEEELKELLEERMKLTFQYLRHYGLFVDETVSNIDYLLEIFRNRHPGVKVAISSYFGQHKHWYKTNACWIYGQLKFGGSLCYKKLAFYARISGKKTIFLYQGDGDKFNVKKPWTYINSVLPKRLRIWIEGKLRQKFIDRFYRLERSRTS
jgi:hypothetical protein